MRDIPNLGLKTVADCGQASAQLRRPGAALALAHAGGEVAAADVANLLRSLAADRRPVPTIVVCEQDRPEQVLEFMRLGAAECLTRPLDLHRLAYLADVLTVRARCAAVRPAPDLIVLDGTNPFLYLPTGGMGRIMEQVQRVAPQETTVLLGGETGTGKTRLARLLHDLSPRHDLPFLTVNCAALAANLMESEMFGHVRGAFTGADRDRVGKFADAGRGTLLLDEIDALPLELQAKFLRVVEERTFEPVGSNRSQAMHARLIVASNRDLAAEVAAGRFRSDLYYRLNVVGFYLPPLRERRDLIRPLAERLRKEFAARNDRPVAAIADDALEALEAYHWPGNIRELRNVIERAVALCPGTEVQLDDLPEALRQPAGGAEPAPAVLSFTEAASGTLTQAKEEAEAARIAAALERNNNNRLRAAAELGISRMTLYKKLHRYGLMGVS